MQYVTNRYASEKKSSYDTAASKSPRKKSPKKKVKKVNIFDKCLTGKDLKEIKKLKKKLKQSNKKNLEDAKKQIIESLDGYDENDEDDKNNFIPLIEKSKDEDSFIKVCEEIIPQIKNDSIKNHLIYTLSEFKNTQGANNQFCVNKIFEIKHNALVSYLDTEINRLETKLDKRIKELEEKLKNSESRMSGLEEKINKLERQINKSPGKTEIEENYYIVNEYGDKKPINKNKFDSIAKRVGFFNDKTNSAANSGLNSQRYG
jgi:hypothetical protein